MRQIYIAGNWKMNKLRDEAKALAEELRDSLRDASVKLMVAPPFTALLEVAGVLRGTGIRLGAQNMGLELSGAHTGEVSAAMLKDTGVETVILGHSERRHIYGETDAMINQKVQLALAEDLEVILCVGELLDEREAGKAEQVVREQLSGSLKGVDAGAMGRLVIAYEPVWAIGTGKTATPQDADDMHRAIRSRLGETFGARVAEETIIQYGGSVKPENAADLLGKENIDGALVGGASLKADSFAAIARSAS
ncbi:MAG: triose-phosphate isomerase [Spirochaetaceae bacterium]